MVDRYTKVILTVIAAALIALLARPWLAPGSATAQPPFCGTVSLPCYVSIVGGPPSLAAWQGVPVIVLDSQRIVPRRY